jgi:osmoprotectant transport system substrate-binding protein
MRARGAIRLLAALAAVGLLAGACGNDDKDTVSDTSTDDDAATTTAETDTTAADADKPDITIGAFNFSESAILANMYGQALEAKGYNVTLRINLGNREVVAPALESGEIDLYPGYVATELEFFNKGKGEATGDAAASVAKLNEYLSAKGAKALTPSPAIDANAFAVTKATADAHKLTKMSDLAAVAKDLTLGGPPECPERPFCIPGLKATYGITFKEFKSLDAGGPLTKGALENGDIDVGLVFSSDGAIPDKGFVVLEDDKHLQNADNVVPVIRDEVAIPDVMALLDDISEKLDTTTLAELNKRADIDKEDPEVLAKEWLTDNGFL